MAAMPTLDGWEENDGRLRKAWALPDFATALALANAIGAMAEEVGHHPDLELGWGRLAVAWTTHDAGGLTDLDRDCARRTDEIVSRRNS